MTEKLLSLCYATINHSLYFVVMFTAAQGGVLEKNLVSVMKGKPLTAKVSYFISTMGPSCMIYYGAVMHDLLWGRHA